MQDGCRYRCTYCIVTLARGDERSRPIEELVTEESLASANDEDKDDHEDADDKATDGHDADDDDDDDD